MVLMVRNGHHGRGGVDVCAILQYGTIDDDKLTPSFLQQEGRESKLRGLKGKDLRSIAKYKQIC